MCFLKLFLKSCCLTSDSWGPRFGSLWIRVETSWPRFGFSIDVPKMNWKFSAKSALQGRNWKVHQSGHSKFLNPGWTSKLRRRAECHCVMCAQRETPSDESSSGWRGLLGTRPVSSSLRRRWPTVMRQHVPLRQSPVSLPPLAHPPRLRPPVDSATYSYPACTQSMHRIN